jgi:ATP adenylyltransferase
VDTYERLWNGWRSAYVSGATAPRGGDGSVFTQILKSGLSDEDANIVHRGRLVFAMLNAFPYATGHTLVMPYREVGDLESLTAEESMEFWGTVTDAVRAIKSAYQPGGVNVGDGNFMTAIANTRTLPEALEDTAAKLRAAWPQP